MAMVGLAALAMAAMAMSPTSSYLMVSSSEARTDSNSEMSAPETKARSPAPRSTITRTRSSSWNAWMAGTMPAHMSRDMALWREGLLNTSQPMPPSMLACSFSVPVSIVVMDIPSLLGVIKARGRPSAARPAHVC